MILGSKHQQPTTTSNNKINLFEIRDSKQDFRKKISHPPEILGLGIMAFHNAGNESISSASMGAVETENQWKSAKSS